MKKIILLLITLTTLTDVSYASFPISVHTQQESVKSSVTATLSGFEDGRYAILGFMVGFLSVFLLFLPLLFLLVPNKVFRRGIYIGLLTVLVLIGLLFSFGPGGIVIM